jgi:DNA polymerase-3 subunit epsilon
VKFLAIDFETADYEPDSACAVGLVRVEEGEIVRREYYLIKPPRNNFFFSYLHGIQWEDVRHKPTFAKVWPKMERIMEGTDFLVAHNARFDRGVLHACCRRYQIAVPEIPFQCTMVLSRRLWRIYPTNLPAVCRHFSIPLDHHNAASDTEACAQIMIRALVENPPAHY